MDYKKNVNLEKIRNSIDIGSYYGSGRKQPVGHKGNPKKEVAALPYGKKK